MGNRLPSTTPSMVLRLRGQASTGPSFVLDQSVARMSAPISPPPANRPLAGAPAEAAAPGGFTALDWVCGRLAGFARALDAAAVFREPARPPCRPPLRALIVAISPRRQPTLVLRKG